MTRRIAAFTLIIIGLMLSMAACSGAEQPIPVLGDSSANAGTGTGGQVLVESIDIQIMESFPVQVVAQIRGNLSDGCTSINQALITGPDAGTFTILFSTARQENVACTEALVPFEERVSLPVESLPAGAYSVRAGGVEQPFELQVDNGPPPDAGTGPAAPISNAPGYEPDACPQGSSSTVRYINYTDGYCLVFPADFTLLEPESLINTTLITQSPTASAGAVTPSLAITVWGAADGRSTATIVDEVLAEAADEIPVQRTPTTIGGQPAEIVAGLPGRVDSRQAWVVANGLIYHLLAQPLDVDYPEFSQQVEALWQTAAGSLVFFSLTDDGLDTATWVNRSFPDIGVALATPADWLQQQGDGSYSIAPPNSANPDMVTVRSLPDAPLDFDGLLAYVLEQKTAQGEVNAQVGKSFLSGWNAIVAIGLSGSCYEAYVPAQGLVRQVSFAREICESDGAPTDLMLAILETVAVSEPTQ